MGTCASAESAPVNAKKSRKNARRKSRGRSLDADAEAERVIAASHSRRVRCLGVTSHIGVTAHGTPDAPPSPAKPSDEVVVSPQSKASNEGLPDPFSAELDGVDVHVSGDNLETPNLPPLGASGGERQPQRPTTMTPPTAAALTLNRSGGDNMATFDEWGNAVNNTSPNTHQFAAFDSTGDAAAVDVEGRGGVRSRGGAVAGASSGNAKNSVGAGMMGVPREQRLFSTTQTSADGGLFQMVGTAPGKSFMSENALGAPKKRAELIDLDILNGVQVKHMRNVVGLDPRQHSQCLSDFDSGGKEFSLLSPSAAEDPHVVRVTLTINALAIHQAATKAAVQKADEDAKMLELQKAEEDARLVAESGNRTQGRAADLMSQRSMTTSPETGITSQLVQLANTVQKWMAWVDDSAHAELDATPEAGLTGEQRPAAVETLVRKRSMKRAGPTVILSPLSKTLREAAVVNSSSRQDTLNATE
jgi:hypothetical protein